MEKKKCTITYTRFSRFLMLDSSSFYNFLMAYISTQKPAVVKTNIYFALPPWLCFSTLSLSLSNKTTNTVIIEQHNKVKKGDVESSAKNPQNLERISYISNIFFQG